MKGTRRFPGRGSALSAVGALLLAATAFAQRPFSGEPQLREALGRLNTTGTVLMIAAHPDDENTALLAYLARGRHVRAVYLSLTRGEGGQNLIGPEQGTLLGVIRTQELWAARRIDGAEQLFSSAVDFGFSKTAEEALRIWNREKILREIVGIVRELQPDVIILPFSGTPRDGHGQHQASAILGKEAYFAAADPKRYPEQLTRLRPWQAKRLLWTPWMGSDLPPHFTVELGAYNSDLGYSYAEIAGLSRSMHRSQSMGSPLRKGAMPWAVVPVAGDAPKDGILDGIDISWTRVPGGANIGNLLARAERDFRADRPDAIVPVLMEARREIAGLPESAIRDEKLREIEDTIVKAAGLWLDAAVPSATGVPGEVLKVTATAIRRTPLAVSLRSVTIAGKSLPGEALKLNEPFTRSTDWRIGEDMQPTATWSPAAGTGLAPPVLTANFSVEVCGETMNVIRPVEQRYVDRLYGERTRPFSVTPRASLRMIEHAVVFPDRAPKQVTVEARAETANVSGDIALRVPAGWTVTPQSQPYSLAHEGQEASLRFDVRPPAAVEVVNASADGIESRPIEYPHIVAQRVILPASAKFVRADIKMLAHHIGYVMGAGDEVPRALEQVGCDVTLLTADDLMKGDLSRYDAIMTGVRAYNVRPDLIANQQRLLDYVSKGGTLVVQYNVLERGDALNIGPYPIKVGRDRVSVEDAPVTVLAADSPLLNAPNRITPSDFEGWVQERGLYFASEWDDRYKPLLESHDPGEKPHPGGMLWTRYGKGVYVFTAYSWFRELPAGVPGAYRIVANLLSAGKTVPR